MKILNQTSPLSALAMMGTLFSTACAGGDGSDTGVLGTGAAASSGGNTVVGTGGNAPVPGAGGAAGGGGGLTAGGSGGVIAGGGSGGMAAGGGGMATGGGGITAGGTSSGGGGATSGGGTSSGGGVTSDGGSDSGGSGGTENTGGTGSSSACDGGDAPGFYVADGKLYDNRCNEFVMRGANVSHAWFAPDTQQSLNDLAGVKGNAVRVVLSTGSFVEPSSGTPWTRTNGTVLADIISWTKANKLVAVLEVHDSTGSGEKDGAVHPDDAVDYWLSSDILPLLQGEEAYVIVNIANEPFGNSTSSSWQSFHEGAVKTLRAGGVQNTLMVDAPNWGQDWEGIMRDGNSAQQIFDADPDKNTVFSVHMYDIYGQASTVKAYLDAFVAKNLPLVIGEFAADHGSSKNVEEATIMSEADRLGFGYLGWSWSGNSPADLESLDITRNFNVNDLTTWGNTLINGANGIQETSMICTCFD